jgi:hypothetical protein
VPQNPKTQTKEREATLTLRYITTQIQCPQNRSEAELAPVLTINLVNVVEEEAPDGVEPLEWMLVTNLELHSCGDVFLVVDYYRSRWKIERFHFVLKNGCGIEEL